MRKVGVGAVLTNAAGQVLLVRTAKAGWELPGGRVESGEDLLQALAREISEEAGAQSSIERLVGVYAHTRQDLLTLIFRGTSTTASPAPRADDKVLEARWFDAAEALRQVTHAREHEALADGLAGAPQLVYRAYDASGGERRLGS
jgi:8-oxo-dGTP diphosphatase